MSDSELWDATANPTGSVPVDSISISEELCLKKDGDCQWIRVSHLDADLKLRVRKKQPEQNERSLN
jgi:hypothetical protein